MNAEAAEVGPAARKRKKKKSPPARTQRDVEVVSPKSPKLGPGSDAEGADGLSPEHTFDLDYTDRRGHYWSGRFACHVLTIKERATVGLTRSRLTANTPAGVIDASTLNILEMQAHLAVALDACPVWAESLGELYDVGVLAAIYREVASHEARFWGTDDGEAG